MHRMELELYTVFLKGGVKMLQNQVWWHVWRAKDGVEEAVESGCTKRIAQRKMERLIREEHLGATYRIEAREGILPAKERIRKCL